MGQQCPARALAVWLRNDRIRSAEAVMKALVIEHDLISQCLLAKLLGERGLEVVTFANAEQAILAYQKEFYPLAFVDADLPGMNGLEFCR